MRSGMVLLSLAAGLAAGSAAAADSSAIVGKWRGSYTCMQGNTGLLLTVARTDGGTLSGEFAFFAVAGNPGVPDGRFVVDVSFSPGSGHVEFKAVEWIERPNDYLMVDLAGQLSEDGRRIDGKVQYSGCADFHVAREGGAVQGKKPTSASK